MQGPGYVCYSSGMTQTSETYTPAVDDIVTITPKGLRQFIVLALDDIAGDMIYVEPVERGEKDSAQWVFLTYVRRVQEQEDTTE